MIIIGISEYTDEGWQNPRLTDSITASVEHLSTFFRTRFGVMPHLLAGREATTSTAIRRFLRTEFQHVDPDTLTVLFVLSHGKQITYNNPLYSQDLLVITSDTPFDAPEGSAISVGTELLTAIFSLPAGSVTLTFLDTCRSGAAFSGSVGLAAKLQELLGLKTMVLASALSRESAFRSMFTEALLRVWENADVGTCTTLDEPRRLKKRLESVLQAPLESTPVAVVTYHGLPCLESFSQHTGLVFLHNVSDKAITARFTAEAGGPAPEDEVLEPSRPGFPEVRPLRLNRGTYTIGFYQEEARIDEWKVELTDARAVAFRSVPRVTLSARVDLQADAARAMEKAVELAETAAAKQPALQVLRLGALEAFTRLHDAAGSGRMVAAINAAGGLGSAWERASEIIAASKPKEILARVRDTSELPLIARYLKARGAFASAAEAYRLAALAEPVPLSSGFPMAAYLLYGAAGKPEESRKVRQLFKLDIGDICKECVAAERGAALRRPNATRRFQELSAKRVLDVPSIDADYYLAWEPTIPKEPIG